jgi:3-oxoacyl-[acyl-carrier-protein] synthase-3
MLFDALFHVTENRVMKNLPEYGNCIAASLPLALCVAIETGRLQRGQTCLLIGTSAGFSVGGALFRY